MGAVCVQEKRLGHPVKLLLLVKWESENPPALAWRPSWVLLNSVWTMVLPPMSSAVLYPPIDY